MIDPPIAQDAYNQLADDYAARIDSKAHNAYYDRPAVLSLLPAVAGQRVLDAGCGPGAYAQWLLGHGAQVVAVDANEKMLAHARARTANRAEFHLANLNAPLDDRLRDAYARFTAHCMAWKANTDEFEKTFGDTAELTAKLKEWLK